MRGRVIDGQGGGRTMTPRKPGTLTMVAGARRARGHASREPGDRGSAPV